jgi:hypothetical protein
MYHVTYKTPSDAAESNEHSFTNPNDTYRRNFFNALHTSLTALDATRLVLNDAGCMTFTNYYNNGGVYAGNPADICGNSDITDTHWYHMFYWYDKNNPFWFPENNFPAPNSEADTLHAMDVLFSYPSDKPHIVTEYGGAYTDEQGNLIGEFPKSDPAWSIKPNDNFATRSYLLPNPARPDDALAYQASVITRANRVFQSIKDTTRLSGIFYHSFDSLVYNPYNLPWVKLKQWYIDSYPARVGINAPVITDATWRNHTTLEPKPGYTTFKRIHSSTSLVKKGTIPIAGRVTDAATGVGIAGVTINVHQNNTVYPSVTDANGNWRLANTIPFDATYAVRIDTPPAGYINPKTTTAAWSFNTCSNTDESAGSWSYECQKAARNDCAYFDGTWTDARCSFTLNAASAPPPTTAPPTAVPDSPTPTPPLMGDYVKDNIVNYQDLNYVITIFPVLKITDYTKVVREYGIAR